MDATSKHARLVMTRDVSNVTGLSETLKKCWAEVAILKYSDHQGVRPVPAREWWDSLEGSEQTVNKQTASYLRWCWLTHTHSQGGFGSCTFPSRSDYRHQPPPVSLHDEMRHADPNNPCTGQQSTFGYKSLGAVFKVMRRNRSPTFLFHLPNTITLTKHQ